MPAAQLPLKKVISSSGLVYNLYKTYKMIEMIVCFILHSKASELVFTANVCVILLQTHTYVLNTFSFPNTAKCELNTRNFAANTRLCVEDMKTTLTLAGKCERLVFGRKLGVQPTSQTVD